MAGNDPSPNEQHQRERDTRRRQADVVVVQADNFQRSIGDDRFRLRPRPQSCWL